MFQKQVKYLFADFVNTTFFKLINPFDTIFLSEVYFIFYKNIMSSKLFVDFVSTEWFYDKHETSLDKYIQLSI